MTDISVPSKTVSIVERALLKIQHAQLLSHEEGKAIGDELTRLRQAVVLVQPEVRGFLERVLARFKEADDERYKNQMEWRAEAERWKREGDWYGNNFHLGMDSGANWTSLFFFRVRRELETILKSLPAETESDDWTAGRLCMVTDCSNLCAPRSTRCAVHNQDPKL